MDGLMSIAELDISIPKTKYHDDSIDRVNRAISVFLLVVAAIIVTTTQYVGETINCWTPSHFTDDHEDYANSYCWIRNTYYLRYHENIPTDSRNPGGPRNPKRLSYYQWVPLILLVQAVCFYLPYRIWSRVSLSSGLDLHSLVEAGQSVCVTDMAEIRDKTLQYMTQMTARYIRSFIGVTPSAKSPCLVRCKRIFKLQRQGNYLFFTYMCIKLLYLVNILGQFFLLDLFLGTPRHAYGFEVLYNSMWPSTRPFDDPQPASVPFPRVTMCDLKVRRLGAVHDYNIMCVLPINLFNEKIFLFVWFWLLFVGIATIASTVIWLARILRAPTRRNYVRRHLRFVGRINDETDREKVRKFVNKYLRRDGVFILRLLAHNTSTITATEFITNLWEHYSTKHMTLRHGDVATDV